MTRNVREARTALLIFAQDGVKSRPACARLMLILAPPFHSRTNERHLVTQPTWAAISDNDTTLPFHAIAHQVPHQGASTTLRARSCSDKDNDECLAPEAPQRPFTRPVWPTRLYWYLVIVLGSSPCISKRWVITTATRYLSLRVLFCRARFLKYWNSQMCMRRLLTGIYDISSCPFLVI